jgi:ABC-type glycerol-3-phosphate transport system substrate-binding protein
VIGLLKSLKKEANMKKILIFMVLGLVSLVLVACGEVTLPTTDAPTTEAPTTAAPTTSLLTTQATTSGTDSTQSTTEYIPTEEIVLSYADWGDAELNQILIDAFEAKYPNIEVELRLDITGSGAEFTGNLINAQAAGVLPDVFAIDNVPTGYYNGMLLDITEYWDNDPETDLVYPNIANTAVYNGERYAVPSFQFIKGIFINMTLFDSYNIP